MKRLLAVMMAFSLAACLDTTGPRPSDPATETFASSLGINLSDTAVWKQTQYGTYYKDEVVGSGPSLTLNDASDSIFVVYTGYLKDGTIFAATDTAGFPAGGVIIGFLDGMVDMRQGGTRLVVIPSNLGYGNAGNGVIPPNSTLIYRITLNDFHS